MKLKQYLIDFALMFCIVLVVNLIVTYLYGLIVHGSGTLDLEGAFPFAISLAIILPWIRRQEKMQGAK
jgi:hypothetical protein